MKVKSLPNYLRMYRKRAGFNQKEIAVLLGRKCGTCVCRDEQYETLPHIRTALEYEVIYQVPVSKLFAGYYEEAQLNVQNRAEELIVDLCDSGSPRLTEKRYRQLNRIIDSCLPVIE